MSLASTMLPDLAAWSRALGVADPALSLREMIESSFDLPLTRPEYKNNELSPGTIPFEISFSEVAPASLRIDLEPWPVDLDPETRRARVTDLVLTLAVDDGARSRFSSAASPHLAAPQPLRFGAFFGASFDRDGLADLRIYYERSPLPQATLLAAPIEGTVPIFESLTLSRNGAITSRLYLCFTAGLRLDDLGPLLAELGLEHRADELTAIVAALNGGSVFAPGQAIAGVREENGSELKLDFIVVPRRAAEAEHALRRHLAERPASEAAYLSWRAAVGAPRLSVLSVKVSSERGASVNAYAHPYTYRLD